MNIQQDIELIETNCPSRTYKKVLPCLTLYITIAYKEDKKIDFIKVYGGQQGELGCGETFYQSLSDLLTFSIRRIRNEHEAKAIIKTLRYHKCNLRTANVENLTSCVDAIGSVLEKELNL
jgi:hypothetical protein